MITIIKNDNNNIDNNKTTNNTRTNNNNNNIRSPITYNFLKINKWMNK